MHIPPKQPDLVALGREVARVRQLKGWSLDALADAAGVSRRTLINVEGATKAPRIDTLFAIAVALDVSLASLVQSVDGRSTGEI
ncbi:MAG: helix-turn-helix transcriptional regulator [Candidatus Saccharibacteria bacterium]|nr:helix-turn-helix transcriptional regulator [Microbacteriaceae bacterium]